jgi:LysM repeat protein
MKFESGNQLVKIGVCALGFLLTTTVDSAAFTEIPRDSIGTERKGSKLLVLHKIEAGETLSSLSRRYNTTVAAIREENNLAADALKLGAVVKVPFNPPAQPSAAALAGKNKKIHVVEAGQTLYSIARAYNLDVETLKQWNTLTTNELSLGQELIVGEEVRAAQTAPPAQEIITVAQPRVNEAGKKIHVVETSQGLFAIARMYGVTVEDLRKWNNLSADNLRVGQELYVEEVPAVERVAVEMPNPEVPAVTEPVREAESVAGSITMEETRPVEETRAEKRQQRREATAERTEARIPEPAASAANAASYAKKVESGLAESINDSAENDLFLALHRTAPVGTILQVRNQMNDLSVFVKVIGKLPDTGANDKLVVKLSRRACERLAVVDKRFRVEVSYMP